MTLSEHTLATAMIERFSAEAIEIAQRQYSLADSFGRPRWAAVYAYVIILLREDAMAS